MHRIKSVRDPKLSLVARVSDLLKNTGIVPYSTGSLSYWQRMQYEACLHTLHAYQDSSTSGAIALYVADHIRAANGDDASTAKFLALASQFSHGITEDSPLALSRGPLALNPHLPMECLAA